MVEATKMFMAECEEERKAQGLSGVALGLEAFGFFDSYNRIKRDKDRTVRVETLEKIAKALGKKVVIYLGDEE